MQTQVIKIDRNNFDLKDIYIALDVLKGGGLVALPTETVYGLVVNVDNEKAREKLYTVKGRDNNKPLAFFAARVEDIDKLAVEILPVVYRLSDKFWPGPLTMVLSGKKEGETVGIRIPDQRLVLTLVREAPFTIGCSSANISSRPEALDAKEVLEQLNGKIDLLLDGGKVDLGIASTVIDARSLPFKILRKGAISEGQIHDVVSKKRVLFVCTGNTCRSVMAEGLLKKKLKDKKRDDVEVFSAGIAAFRGTRASGETQQLLGGAGVDVTTHFAQSIDDAMLKRSDLILVMERFQEESIISKFPYCKERVYLLKEFSRYKQDNIEISDPIGKGLDYYRNTFLEIQEAIERLVNLI